MKYFLIYHSMLSVRYFFSYLKYFTEPQNPYLYFPLPPKPSLMRKHALVLTALFLLVTSVFAQKDDTYEPVPLTFSWLEKCLYVSADSAQKLIYLAGFNTGGTSKQLDELKLKWKPNRCILMKKGTLEIVIVFSTSNVFTLVVRSESAKDKTGENLFIDSFKAGYKESTHDNENPRISKNGPKKTVKYDTNNKPWTLELTGKN
jgi:hypothetical protein